MEQQRTTHTKQKACVYYDKIMTTVSKRKGSKSEQGKLASKMKIEKKKMREGEKRRFAFEMALGEEDEEKSRWDRLYF